MTGISVQDYLAHDAVGLAHLVCQGEVHPNELLAAAIARADAVNPSINALSQRLDQHGREQIANGLPQGRLRGVPFLVKDLFIDMAGTPSSNGSVLFKDAVAARDSTAVQRYKAVGLVIFGKTSSPEFGNALETHNRLIGQTLNPWDLTRSPGGSSGGAAAAVAAGIVPAANASDAYGSIRVPASCCGLFGLKPSRARVSLGPGRYEGGGGVATIHALTRSVRDSAVLLEATQGEQLGDPYPSWPGEAFSQLLERPPARLRIALMVEGWNGLSPSAECRAALDDAGTLCESLGHAVEYARPRIDVDLLERASSCLRGAGLIRMIEAHEKRSGRPVCESDLDPITWYLYREGAAFTACDVLEARDAMFTLHRQMAAFMQSFDVLLSPTLAEMPPLAGRYALTGSVEQHARSTTEFSPYAGLFNMTGQPSMSVPLHRSKTDIPIGTMFSARFGEEGLLLRLAYQLEQERPWAHRIALNDE